MLICLCRAALCQAPLDLPYNLLIFWCSAIIPEVFNRRALAGAAGDATAHCLSNHRPKTRRARPCSLLIDHLACILQVLDRPALAAQLRLLEHDASANDLWDDPAKAQVLLKEIDRLKDGVAAADGFTALLEDACAALEMTEQEACTCFDISQVSAAEALASVWCAATHDVDTIISDAPRVCQGAVIWHGPLYNSSKAGSVC